MSAQPRTAEPEQLFDPRTLEQPRCEHCGTDRKNLCRHDYELDQGLVSRTRKRPKTCLNSYEPATAPWPEGF